MARQASFVDPAFMSGGRVTRRKAFLDQTGSVVPWADLVALVDAKRPRAGRRGRAVGLAGRPRVRGLRERRAGRHDAPQVPPHGGGGARSQDRGQHPRQARQPRPPHARRPLRRCHDRGGAGLHQGRERRARPRDAPDEEGGPVALRGEVPRGHATHVASEALAAVSVSDARGAHGLVRGDGRAAHADAGCRGIGGRPGVASGPRPSKVGPGVAAMPPKPGETAGRRPAGRGRASVGAHAGRAPEPVFSQA